MNEQLSCVPLRRCATGFLLAIACFPVWAAAQGQTPAGDAVTPAPARAVRDCGARGDGQADDTAALQQAAERGGDIRLPRGTYRITRPIVIDLDRAGYTSITGDGTATLVMAGPGPALRIVGTHTGTADPQSVKDPVWQRQRNPQVDGLEIVGAHPEAIGLSLEGTMQAIITRVAVRQALHGILLTGRNRNVIVSECHLYDNRGAGLLLEKLDLHQVNVTNCHISYNRAGGIVVRDSSIRNFQIGSCDIEANMDPAGPPAANVLLDCSAGRSSVREGAIVGCTLQHSGKAHGSANIRFIGHSAAEAHKVGFFSIAANQLSDTAVNVHLVHARGVSVTGNTFFLGHEHNLLVEGCAQVVAGANLFERNPDYPPGSRDGLLFSDCVDCTLSGLQVFNTLAQPGALVLRRCRRMNLSGCTILDCDGGGLLLEDVRDVLVSGCLVRDDRPGRAAALALKLTGGSGNRIAGNLLSGRVEIAPGSAVEEGGKASASCP